MTTAADRPHEPAAVATPAVPDDLADEADRDSTVYADDRPARDAAPLGDVEPTSETVVARSLPLPVTGNDMVDEALARMADLDDRTTAEHAEIYEDVQGRLQRALADLDGR